jgi:hypothetical protein
MVKTTPDHIFNGLKRSRPLTLKGCPKRVSGGETQ